MMWAVLNTNFWAAILGAAVGGGISLLGSILERRAAAKERRAQDLQRRRAVCASILAKLTQLHRIVGSLAIYQTRARKDAPERAELWTYIRPLAALPPPGRFSDEESAELLLLDFKLFTDVLVYADRVHVSVATHERYSAERSTLLAMITPDKMEGFVGTAFVDEDLAKSTASLRGSLNDLAENCFKHDVEDAAKGLELLQQLVAAINEKTGTELSVSPVQPVTLPTA